MSKRALALFGLALAGCDLGGAFAQYCADHPGVCDDGGAAAGGAGAAAGGTAGGMAGGATAGGAAGGSTGGGTAGGTAGGSAGGAAGGAAGGSAGGSAGGMQPPVCDGGPCNVSLVIAGAGSGQIRFDDGGVACAAGSCSFLYDAGTRVSVVAAPAAGSGVVSWSAPCSTVGAACTFTVTGPVTETLTLDPYNKMFVSSAKVAPGSLGGLDGGDALCNALARDAGLPGEYRAWLRTRIGGVLDRFTDAGRGWLRTDGRPFADTLTGALAQFHPGWYPPSLDERGRNLYDAGTPYYGELAISPCDSSGFSYGTTCRDWTSTATDAGRVGIGLPSGNIWMSAGQVECDVPVHLYCFGIDWQVPLPQPTATGRFAFVTDSLFTPGGGFAAADAICANEAADAGLPGSYRALLTPQDGGFAARLDAGVQWVRPDGIVVAADTAGLLSGRSLLLAPFAIGVGGPFLNPLAPGEVWTGFSPTGNATCSDWASSTNGFATTGIFTDTTPVWSTATQFPCSESKKLFCLQR